MKHEHEEHNQSSVSPSSVGSSPFTADAASLYAAIMPNAQHISLMNTQIFAANPAAALVAARLASAAPSIYQSHLFTPWHLPTSNTSPPISPITSALSLKGTKKMGNNNNIVSTTTNELMPNNNNNLMNNNNIKIGKSTLAVTTKKATGKRKAAANKKELMTPPSSLRHHPYQQHLNPMDVHQSSQVGHNVSPGPISPPTSGSSPQSTGSMEHQSPSSSSAVPISTSTRDPSRDKVFTCKICERAFGYKHVLQNHERTHTGEKPFVCTEPHCNKRFTRDHHLKTHTRLHTGEKPYHCEVCGKRFVQVANLRRHTRVHTGEKPYTCDICSQKFSDSNQLKAHALVHTNEKPFKCDSCHHRFRRRHHLGNHKCSINSPPTPAMSPAMSLDNKSASSRSDASEHSLDLGRQNSSQLLIKQIQQHTKQLDLKPQLPLPLPVLTASYSTNVLTNLHPIPMPLDLSVDETSDTVEKRNRKSHDVRRILRAPTQIVHIPTQLPEQTEPEDLSMHSPRSATSNEEDLDDLDDAESLNRRHRTSHTLTTPVTSNSSTDRKLPCCYCNQTFDNIETMKHHLHIKHAMLPLSLISPSSPAEMSN